MLNKLLFLLFLIFFGIILGYFIQYLDEKKKTNFPVKREKIRKNLQKIFFFLFSPISIIGAIWVANIQNIKAIYVPMMGLTAFFLGAIFAYIGARFLKLSKPNTGLYIISGSYSNIGSIGGLVCFAFFGEAGYALTPIYNFVLPAIYFALGFPIVKHFTNNYEKKESVISRFLTAITDPFVLFPIGSITIGLLLNFSNISRPPIYGNIIAVTVPVGNFLVLVSIGLELKISKVKDYLRECAVLSLIKFLLIPFFTTIIAWRLGLGEIANGLHLKVVIVLSSMPVALIALIPSSLYNLGLNMVNSCWLFTTAAMIFVIPVLYFLVNLF